MTRLLLVATGLTALLGCSATISDWAESPTLTIAGGGSASATVTAEVVSQVDGSEVGETLVIDYVVEPVDFERDEGGVTVNPMGTTTVFADGSTVRGRVIAIDMFGGCVIGEPCTSETTVSFGSVAGASFTASFTATVNVEDLDPDQFDIVSVSVDAD
ncbi:MAG: hypothetical protein H6733_11625 [Alphaproteobacteria bacterium]|nr:hypothetical protein [Alphaproteobacteria bacterium]